MPKLDDLPVELLAHVALFANKQRELLALRCASRSCKDAVRRAAKQHRAVVHFYFQGSSAQKIAALGRVFGSGCRSLTFESLNSEEYVSVLQDFVTSTDGQLRFFYSGESSSYFSMPALLELVRACPLLKTLIVHGSSSSIITAANLDDFASAVGSACPLLEYVRLPHQRSMAEDYQWHFPRFKCISFYRCGDFSAICWDKIELTLRTCVHATGVDLSAQTVSPRLVDLILAAPGAGRIKGLDFNEATISPELILRLAGGLEALSDLQFPHNFDAGRAFYSSLVRARPSIAKFSLGFCNKLDDDALRIVCHGLRLERLELTYAQNLTDRAIDIILESPCADTLRSIDIGYDHQFSSEDVLRLVRGCTELAQLEWENDDLDRDVDGANVDAVDALLVSRGGRASGAAYW